MVSLSDLASGFLEADGFSVRRGRTGLLLAERAGTGGTLERRAVLVRDSDSTPADARTILEAFAGESAASGADVQRFYLTPSLTGLANELRQKANEAGISVRVSAQFFDTPYKVEADNAFGSGQGRSARSVFEDFVRRNADLLERRVPQPFHALQRLGEAQGGFGAGDDLVAHLAETLSRPADQRGDQARLIVIAGAAGAGKSVAFAALFKMLDAAFAEAKRAQRLASRPILFLPEHIREQPIESLSGLMEAVSGIDAAAPTRPTLMRWLNARGMTTWMFDGLDEFFTGESDFVPALEAQLASPSQAQIVVCTRDSLLTSSSGLGTLIDRHIGEQGTGKVVVYELDRWQRPSQAALAALRLDGRPLAPGARPGRRVADFLAMLDASPAASELATLPFYCDLLLSLAAKSRRTRTMNDLDLLAEAVDALIDREAGKLGEGAVGFGWDVFSGTDTFEDLAEAVEARGGSEALTSGDLERIQRILTEEGRDRLIAMLEGLAHLMRCSTQHPGERGSLKREEIEAFAELTTDVIRDERSGIEDRALARRVVVHVVQMAFFGQAAERGAVSFSHEIIADYLAGRHAARMIIEAPDDPNALGQAVGIRADLDDRSVFLRTIVDRLAASPAERDLVVEMAGDGRVRPAYAANAERLARLLQRAPAGRRAAGT